MGLELRKLGYLADDEVVEAATRAVRNQTAAAA